MTAVADEMERYHARQWLDKRGKLVTSFTAYNAKVRRMQRTERLRVTFKMLSPIAVSDYIHFDALVWHAALEEQLGMAFWNQTGRENYDLLLPLKYIVQCFTREGVVHKQTGEPLILTKKYYAASVGLYEKGFVEGVTAWRKRCDFPPELGKVDVKRGLFKAYDVPLTYVSAPEITFYAVGNRDEVERLLKNHISHIGKKRSQGFGQVGEIVVEGFQHDWSVFRDGVLQRPIPVDGCKFRFAEPIEAFYAYRPPYWRVGSLVHCFMPGSRLSLKTAEQMVDNRCGNAEKP